MKHELKIYPKYFRAIRNDQKTFEIRDERDRKFAVRDWLRLREWSPYPLSGKGDYTGCELMVQVTHIQRIRIGQIASFAIMSIRKKEDKNP